MYEDDPQDLVFDLLGEAIFDAHPLGRAGDRTRPRSSARSRASSCRRSTRERYLPGDDRDRGRRLGRPRRARGDGRGGRGAPATAPRGGTPRRGRGAVAEAPAFVPRVRFLEKDTEQYHLCARRPGDRPRRRAPLRAAGARRRARRHVLLAPLPGGARAARPRLLGLHLLATSTPTPARSACTSARARRTSPRPWRWSRPSSQRCVQDPASEEELDALARERQGPRRARARVHRGAHEPARRVACSASMPILSVDEMIERIDAVEHRGRARARRASCSPRRACRWPAWARGGGLRARWTALLGSEPAEAAAR